MKQRTNFWCVIPVLATLLVACGDQSSGRPRTAKPATPARKFYWIQPLKGHPVHQLTQIAFKEGCKQVGYEFEMAGTDTWDVGGTLALAEQVLARGDAAGMAIWTGNPAVVAALSTTGGGPITWANAQKETGRKLVIVGMDYTRVNLDLVKSGEVYAVIGQPLWEESYRAAELLAKALRGEKVEWWT